jgi:hypothetical protein
MRWYALPHPRIHPKQFGLLDSPVLPPPPGMTKQPIAFQARSLKQLNRPVPDQERQTQPQQAMTMTGLSNSF